MMITRGEQAGMTLIESMVAMLLFSMGILALVGMYATATSRTSDSQYRIEAANFANRMIGEIWANVDRSTAANLTSTLMAFQHRPGDGGCAFNGNVSANAAVTQWVTDITTAGTGLPGADNTMQQIIVDTANANRVTVTVCWRAPTDTTPHRHVVVANIN
jgi:type IV pilus assembly protein PilV